MIWIPALLAALGFFMVFSARGGPATLSGVFSLFLSVALLVCVSGEGTGAALPAQALAVVLILSGAAHALVGHALVSGGEEDGEGREE